MARRRRSRGGGHRRRRIHRSRMATLGQRFLGVFRKPLSKVIAPTLGISAIIYLVFNPLPNGDSWMKRLSAMLAQQNVAGSAGNPLGVDSAGNSIPSILGLQLINNLTGAVPLLAGAALAGIAGRLFKI